MYNMNDYRAALSERDRQDLGSKEWNLCQLKVNGIVAALVAVGNKMMVAEVVDEVYSLNDCGMEFENEAVQFDIWLLESNGYTEQASKLRKLDWN